MISVLVLKFGELLELSIGQGSLMLMAVSSQHFMGERGLVFDKINSAVTGIKFNYFISHILFLRRRLYR